VESASSELGAGSSAGRSESFFDEERGDFFAPPHELKLAVVGRPNVGKSSLVNALLGSDRMVVHDLPGTTRDAVSAHFAWRGREILIADTAGIRRHAAGGEHREELDRMAVARARQMVMASHVSLLMFDATMGLTRGDLQIADLVIEHGKSCIILANKVDLLQPSEVAALKDEVATKLPMLWYAPVVEASALHRVGIDAALDLVLEASEWRERQLPRRRLHELFKRAQLLRPLPKVRAAKAAQAGRIKILYVLQAQTETPTFVVHLNRQADLHVSDKRWIENTIRSQWPFTATPLRLIYRSRDRRRRRRLKETKGARGPSGGGRSGTSRRTRGSWAESGGDHGRDHGGGYMPEGPAGPLAIGRTRRSR